MTEKKPYQPSEEGMAPEKLLQYLEQQMSMEEQHAFEKDMDQDPFTADALDGLESIPPTRYPAILQEIHQKTRLQLQKKQKKKQALSLHFWIYFSLVLLLLLLLVAYWVVRQAMAVSV